MNVNTKAEEREWPFAAWLRIAVNRFHLNPDVFWALPMQEWRTLLNAAGDMPMPRASLDALAKKYPDINKDTIDDER